MLKLFNSLTRQKEEFVPIEPGRVRMYVCGMTVYDLCHLGHARVLVVFDVIVRHFRSLGYDVTYVRNITDVGHLTDDADEGDDKLAVAAQNRDLSADRLEREMIPLDEVIAAADEHGMAMVFTGMRHFRH